MGVKQRQRQFHGLLSTALNYRITDNQGLSHGIGLEGIKTDSAESGTAAVRKAGMVGMSGLELKQLRL
jgi:hypothetical protein